MYISRIKLHNFKRFKSFDKEFNSGLNILVGDNEVGKSTILEAIHLALSGMYRGRYLKSDLTHYIFNQEAIHEYFQELKDGKKPRAPYLSIEVWFDDCPSFVGNTNSESDARKAGLTYSVILSDDYTHEFNEYVKNGDVQTIPIEYYTVVWQSFRRDPLMSRKIPLKSFLIDGSISQGSLSGVFIAHILRNILNDSDCVNLSHVHREYQQYIENHPKIKELNERLNADGIFSEYESVNLTSDYSSSRSWETTLIANINSVPIHYAGKGCQIGVRTKLSLVKSADEHKNAVILIEEPESHLSFSSMNRLISFIQRNKGGRQIFITTHSSFVINKLGLNSLVLFSSNSQKTLTGLSDTTFDYFQKLAGYETLRMLLAKKTILVEGDSDELIIQKAYYQNFGKLPIEDGIDIQCIKGLSFLRYLELATLMGLNVTVVTDNDGNLDAIKEKYIDYIGENKKANIRICFSEQIYSADDFSGDVVMDKFNFNTLEPILLKSNSLALFNRIFDKSYTTDKELLKYMHNNKSECALALLRCTDSISIPEYILRAIEK